MRYKAGYTAVLGEYKKYTYGASDKTFDVTTPSGVRYVVKVKIWEWGSGGGYEIIDADGSTVDKKGMDEHAHLSHPMNDAMNYIYTLEK